jgi:hypothetical protein
MPDQPAGGAGQPSCQCLHVGSLAVAEYFLRHEQADHERAQPSLVERGGEPIPGMPPTALAAVSYDHRTGRPAGYHQVRRQLDVAAEDGELPLKSCPFRRSRSRGDRNRQASLTASTYPRFSWKRPQCG